MGEAYAVHDTTTRSLLGKAKRAGLGTLHDKNQGILACVTLAVPTDGARLPLGVLGAELIVRHEVKHTRRRLLSKRMRNPERDSDRRTRGPRRAVDLMEGSRRLIYVADREADIYVLLPELTTGRHRFIVCASADWLVEVHPKVFEPLFEVARKTPTTFTIDVPLTKRHKHSLRRTNGAQVARTAKLSFAATPVSLNRPDRYAGHLPKKLKENVWYVFELGPPLGGPPVEWLLLISGPVDARAGVRRVVDGYRAGWTMEEYFKTLKIGCAHEARRLESFRALSCMLPHSLVVANAMLLMLALLRTQRSMPAEAVFSETELDVFRCASHRLPRDPTLREALLAVPGMGGHLRNNGDPG